MSERIAAFYPSYGLAGVLLTIRLVTNRYDGQTLNHIGGGYK
ncbi:MAG: hypothetical protein ACXVIG_03500 [Halobacteriota archaeon]